jgi:hypothetical protein
MAHDHNDIYSIVERLRILEEGLDKNQKSVNQLSATFKPKTVAVLTAKTDPKNPMAGKLVGGSESVEKESNMLEAEVVEDVIEKVKNSFKDFIKQAEEQIKDSDIKEKKSEDTDLKSRDKKDRDLIAKPNPVTEDPNPVKTIALSDGMICEIHGNEHVGFEIRRGSKCMPTRFKDLAQAEMALEMFAHRQRRRDEAADYIDEA